MLVHEDGKSLFTASDMFRQGHAGIVAGSDDHAMGEVIHRDLLANLDEHAGTGGLPGFFTHQHLVVKADIAGFQFLEHRVGSHDLGQAGRFQALVGVIFRQHLATVEIQEQMAGGGDMWRRGYGCCGETPCKGKTAE